MSFIILQRTEKPILVTTAGVDYELPGLWVREVNSFREFVLDNDKALALRFSTRKEAEAAMEEAASRTDGCEVVEVKGPDWEGEPTTLKGFILRALERGAHSPSAIRAELSPQMVKSVSDETLELLGKEVIHLVKSKAETKTKAKGGNGRVKAAKVLRDCHCGCGGQTFSNFVVGHDARVYSMLRKEAKGEKVKLPSEMTNDGDLLSAMREKVH